MSQDHDLALSSDKHSRSSSRDRKSKIIREFTLDLFIEKQFISSDELKSILDLTQQQFNIKSIHFNNSKQIPDLEGSAFSIEDFGENKLQTKCDAALHIFQCIESRIGKNKEIVVILLIPEGIVPYLIGTKGGQINKIMQETKAHVIVNQPILKFAPRTVKIEGDSQKIYNAIKVITKKIQERGVTEEDYTKMSEPLDPSKLITKAKFAYPGVVIDYIMKYRSEFETKSDIIIKSKVGDPSIIRHFKRDEKLLYIQGKLLNIQSVISNIIKKVATHFTKEDFELKIVMPYSFASKLIGAQGCLIQELAHKSGGALIKVLSDKKETNLDSYCMVQVAGTTQKKQEACALVLEQIEQFKNGGPILESGRFINNNFASQYKNSVRQEVVDKPRRYDLQTQNKNKNRSSSSESYRNSRSRSSSKMRHRKRSPQQQNRKFRKSSERRSYSPSTRKTDKTQISIIVQTKVIDVMEKQKKFREIKNQFRIGLDILYSKHFSESTVRLDGSIKDCLAVIEKILVEQSKIVRK